MATQEISNTNWQEFCDRFTELHRGSLVTVETMDWSGHATEVAKGLPLVRMELDKGGACSDVLRIEAGEPPHKPVCHSVMEPIHFKVQEDADGKKYLRIQAEEGTTIIRFSSGRIEGLLDGLRMVTDAKQS